jgi:hypothetical protein
MLNLDREEISKKPPLASALQSFETSIFLLSLRRYPAALVACGSAIESAIKATPGYPSGSGEKGMMAAIEFAFGRKPRLVRRNIGKFRDARNDFTHEGYSPKDDGRAIELLIGIGFPLLSQCLYEFHKISLRKCVIDGIWNQIETAKNALIEMRRATHEPTSNQITSLSRAIEHTVMTCFRNPVEGKWTDADHGLPDHEWAAKQEFKSKLETSWNFHTYVRCPISTCESPDCLVCLDESSTENLVPLRLFCFDCKFFLDDKGKILAQYLVGKQIGPQRGEILREYDLE